MSFQDYTPGAGISEMAQCSVCTQPTSWNHYGTVTCNSCACKIHKISSAQTVYNGFSAFFRRTVSNGLSYACTCRMPYRRKKKGKPDNQLVASVPSRVLRNVKWNDRQKNSFFIKAVPLSMGKLRPLCEHERENAASRSARKVNGTGPVSKPS